MRFKLPLKYFVLLKMLGIFDKRSKREVNCTSKFSSLKRQTKFGIVS